MANDIKKDDLNTTKEELLKSASLPMFHNKNISEAMITQSKKIDEETKTEGKYKIQTYRQITGPASTAVLKLFHMAITYLTCDDITKRIARTPDGRLVVDPTVTIPLIAYGELNGYKLRTQHYDDPIQQAEENRRAKSARNHFRNKIKKVLTDMKSINYYFDSIDETIFDSGYLISRTTITKINGIEYICINFDVSIAKQILGSPKVQNALPLYLLDDRNPNAYYIGYTLASHASITNNINKNTANTLKVKTLLSKIPETTDYITLKQNGERNWKVHIKGQLEDALNKNISVNFLNSWIYRNSSTGEILTSDEANFLSYEEYIELNIDFEISENAFSEHFISQKFKKVKHKELPSPPIFSITNSKEDIDDEDLLPF